MTLVGGGHSLGHVHIATSGYGFVDPTADTTLLNAWDSTPAILDNQYYISLARQVKYKVPSRNSDEGALVLIFTTCLILGPPRAGESCSLWTPQRASGNT